MTNITCLFLLAALQSPVQDAIRGLASDDPEVRDRSQASLAEACRTSADARKAVRAAFAAATDPEAASRLSQIVAGIEWIRLANPPVKPRSGFHDLSDGKIAVVWGGASDETDGAVFDAATSQWRALAKAPIGPRVLSTTARAGDRLVVWSGGDHDAYARDGALYDLKTGKAEAVAGAPIAGRQDPATGVFGSRVLFWGGRLDPNDLIAARGPVQLMYTPPTYLDDGAIFDTATGKWETMVQAPIKGRDHAAIVWTGTRLFVWGGAREVNMTSDPAPLSDGAVYDGETKSWRTLPDSPLKGGWSRAFVVGRRVVVWNRGAGAAYDFDKDAWETVADCGIKGAEVVGFAKERLLVSKWPAFAAWDGKAWTRSPDIALEARVYARQAWDGDTLIVQGGHKVASPRYRYFDDGAAWRFGADKWKSIAACPLKAESRHWAAVAWTGTRLVVWGGEPLRGEKGRPEPVPFEDAAVYDLKTDAWSLVPRTATHAPDFVRNPRFVSLGDRLLVVDENAASATLFAPADE